MSSGQKVNFLHFRRVCTILLGQSYHFARAGKMLLDPGFLRKFSI
jgi:hypothetical protein